MLDRPAIKQEARTLNRAAGRSVIIAALIYLSVIFLLQSASTYASGDFVNYMRQAAPEMPIPPILIHEPYPRSIVIFVSFFTMLLSFVLGAGWRLFLLEVRRGEHPSYGTLLDGFAFAGKLIVLNLLIRLFVILWSALFVIPGIIAWYRYRFAVYNLCENPDISVTEALNMSKAQTYGHKSELFVLDLSFLGWFVVSLAAFYVPLLWVAPYYMQTDIGYFQRIKREKGVGLLSETDSRDPFDPENR